MKEVLLGACADCQIAKDLLFDMGLAELQAHDTLSNPPGEAERQEFADGYRELTRDGTRLLRCDGSGTTYEDEAAFVAYVCEDLEQTAIAQLARVERCATKMRRVLSLCTGGTSFTTTYPPNGPSEVHSICPVRARLAALRDEF